MQAVFPWGGWLSSVARRLRPGARRAPSRGAGQAVCEASGLARFGFRPSNPPDEMDGLVSQMLTQHRYALLLRPQIAEGLNERQFEAALEALSDQMSLVPEGVVAIDAWRDGDEPDDRDVRLTPVPAVFLDRFAVTNAQYKQFMDAGGYEDMALWDEQIWPGVLELVDRTGEPGPRFWENGAFPPGKASHPVVGVCWYEATAYARWVGKRLPSDPEWIKAAAWPVPGGGERPSQRKFPWGDSADHHRANVWNAGLGDTAPVDAFAPGASVGQAHQLVGNVWEWTSSNFGAWFASPGQIDLPRAMKSIRGGAYDTYFSNHASCQFPSGEEPLARKHNIGFRCAVSADELAGVFGEARNDEPELAVAGAAAGE